MNDVQRKYRTEVVVTVIIIIIMNRVLVAPISTTTFFMVDFLMSFLVVSIPFQPLVRDHHQKKPLPWLAFPQRLVSLDPGHRSLDTINLVQLPMDVLVPLILLHHRCSLVHRSHSSHPLVSISWTSQPFGHSHTVVPHRLTEWTNFH